MAGKPKRERFRVVRGKLVVHTLDDLSLAVGRTTRMIQRWFAQGCPGKLSNGYDVAAVVSWAIENINAEGAVPSRPQPPVDPEDPLLADGVPTEALERLRLATAKIKELELSVKRKELVPVAGLQNLLLQAASRIREAGERLGRMFGREAQLVLDEAIDAAETLIDQMGNDGDGAG